MDDHHCLCTPLDSSKYDDVFVQVRYGDQNHQVRTGARTTTSTTMRVQVPLRIAKYIYGRVPLLPLPTTPDIYEMNVYNYRRPVNDYLHYGP